MPENGNRPHSNDNTDDERSPWSEIFSGLRRLRKPKRSRQSSEGKSRMPAFLRSTVHSLDVKSVNWTRIGIGISLVVVMIVGGANQMWNPNAMMIAAYIAAVIGTAFCIFKKIYRLAAILAAIVLAIIAVVVLLDLDAFDVQLFFGFLVFKVLYWLLVLAIIALNGVIGNKTVQVAANNESSDGMNIPAINEMIRTGHNDIYQTLVNFAKRYIRDVGIDHIAEVRSTDIREYALPEQPAAPSAPRPGQRPDDNRRDWYYSDRPDADRRAAPPVRNGYRIDGSSGDDRPAPRNASDGRRRS